MTPDDAKVIFSVWRHDGRDHADPSFKEALDLAHHHPELLQWLHHQQDFDAMMAASLHAVHGPLDGRSAILAQGRLALARRSIRRKVFRALAAVVLFAVIPGLWHYFDRFEPVLPPRPFTLADAAEHLSVHHKAMEFYSENSFELKAWLAGRGSPVPEHLPGRLSSLKSYGCQDWNTSRGRVSLLCFYPEQSQPYSADAEWLHLFVFPEGLSRLPDATPVPRVVERDAWVFVLWREGENAYALGLPAKPGARERLRTLIGA